MATWLEAHRLANIAAANAHHDLGVDTSHWRIDVAAAIARADVVLMWRPMPLLFGAYLNEPGDRPGILINNQLSHAVGRHTAAHELGHHQFGHPTRYDGELGDGDEAGDGPTIVGLQSTRRSWPEGEKVAEAFASWFLMPRRAVLAGLRLLGIDRPRDEIDVYRLSVLLGVPYRTLARHLLNIRLAGSAKVRAWTEVPPTRIKASLDRHVRAPASRRGAVWLVDSEWRGQTLDLHLGDRIVFPLANTLVAPPPPWLEVVPARRGDTTASIVLEAVSPGSASPADINVRPNAHDGWHLNLRFEAAPSGLDSHWRDEQE